MSVVSDTLTILEAFIIGAVEGSTVYPRYECKVNPADLPVFIILPQGGVPAHESFRNYNTGREYIIFMLIEKLGDDQPQQQQEARERGYDYLDTIPDYFVAHPMLNDQGFGTIVNSTLPRENGVQLTSWGGDPFSGIEFRVTIVTSKEVS